jgi:hypothetical protein
MHHGHLRTLCLAALRVQQPASVRHVLVTLSGACREPPNPRSVLHALQRLSGDGLVARIDGRPVTYRLATE